MFALNSNKTWSKKAVINTLTWTRMQLICMLLTPPETKALLLLSDPDLQVPSWDSMCYTSHSPFAKPPAALLPIPPTCRWHRSHTPALIVRTHALIHKKNSHRYNGQQMINSPCEESREKHMATNINTLRIRRAIFIIQILFQHLSAWDCIFTQTQFLFLSHT